MRTVRERRPARPSTCRGPDLEVLTGLTHQHVPLARPAVDHVAVAPAQGQRAELRALTGWEGAWEGPGRLSDHSAVVVDVELEPDGTPAACLRERSVEGSRPGRL